ncbi:MAG: hypothetical protein IPK44_01480 [Candidatus Accumulibacter sp.]|uniref:hypothetical protein n=1 Tax=Accumulibacter sp. TaxID=2053492 RepID=UPI00258470A6|nr:hypothetical protein [Accumulibacter sp.]MBK8113271.1 hypothetical protein [Accumulibacter sp.]
MASSKFNLVQLGHQTALGTAVDPTIEIPMKAAYEDKRQVHTAEWDSGNWTPTTIVAQVASETAFTLEGTAFFEMMPVLLSSGLANVTASGTPPAAIHTYVVSPSAIGVPTPLTALVGTVGMTGTSGTPFVTGPMIKLKDLYLKTLTLSGNINDKAVMCKAEFFGTTYDAGTSNAGFPQIVLGTLPTLEMINALKGVLKIDDTTAVGWAWSAESTFSCALLDWEWTLDTGIEPAWCLTDNVTTWSALKYTSPSCEFKPVFRTSSVNYALVKAKADALTYQDMQLLIAGSTADRSLTINMTGLWDTIPTVHDEQDGEVVMKPTFRCQTPHTVTSAWHWLTVITKSLHVWA